ncbi:expressed unknown protein [Seminavis robusta]|uniref:Uncharacterized protein n=1 Tax=Seminavis robusta TaxID=568900 RepID=A0A9N8ECE8_9STRA|nr:expressed unknown protein [Seminavis robusta]|eukprot:Sro968_g226000.1 n/a (394) ;mRNA; f:16469-17650
MTATTTTCPVVDLTVLDDGDSFQDALVRLESPCRVVGDLVFFWFRQQPAVKFYGSLDGYRYNHSPFVDGQTTSSAVVISGVIRSRSNRTVNLTSVVLQHSSSSSAVDATATTATPSSYRRRYHRPIAENAPRDQVLKDPRLLRHILENHVPLEDMQTCIFPVHPLWECVGRSLLVQSKFQTIGEYNNTHTGTMTTILDIQSILQQIFRGAAREEQPQRHNNNNNNPFRRTRTSVFPNSNQADYEQLLQAAAHVCAVALRRGGARFLTPDTYVQTSALEILHRCLLHSPNNNNTNETVTQFALTPTASMGELAFLRAACIQLSQLQLQTQRDHIQKMAQALLSNHGTMVPHSKEQLLSWTKPLASDNLLCEPLKQAGEELFGVGWFWDPLPAAS